MEHERKQYFAENEYDDVKGFTILKADEESGEYHIAEKWLKDAETSTWIDYWIPESSLLDRKEAGDCELKATLTDDQFAKVCDRVEWYTDEIAAAEA